MLKLAAEWGKVTTVLPKVEMLPGENHRDRVLAADEETRYLEGATAVGEAILQAHAAALEGIRATIRGEEPTRPSDPFLLRDVATVLLDCGLRPDECFRLRWEHIRGGALHIPFGKTANARRTIPMTPRLTALIEMRRTIDSGEWVFPAPTRSGHIEKSTLKKQHPKAYQIAKVAAFSLYTFRHTCLTRWAEYIGCVHTGVSSGTQRLFHHAALCSPAGGNGARCHGTGTKWSGWAQFWAHCRKRGFHRKRIIRHNSIEVKGINGRGEWIRTTDLLVPNQAL